MYLNIPYCIDLTWNPLNIYITKYKIKQFLKVKSEMKQVNLIVCPGGGITTWQGTAPMI